MIPWFEVVEIGVLASLVACNTWLVVRSLPAALIERQKRVEGVVEAFRTEVQTITAQGAEQRVAGERLAQEVSTYLDQIERKRSSTAASASRMASAQPPAINVAQMSRADQIAYLRRSNGG